MITAATQCARAPLHGRDRIGVRVGRVLGRFKMAKHFTYTITETGITYARDEARIAAEAALDGIYVIRTHVPAETLGATDVVAAYKSLSHVECAFRTMKSPELDVRLGAARFQQLATPTALQQRVFQLLDVRV